MKICNKCGYKKEYNEFYKHKRYKDGLETNCKSCKKLYQFENKDLIKEKKKRYVIENKLKLKEYKDKYRLENPEKAKSSSDKWYNKMKECDISKEKYKEKKNNYHKYKMSNDIIYRVRNLTTNLISKGFRQNGYSKKSRINEILGCSFEEFKLHLESKFEDWMTWENRGKYNGYFNYGWDIDHIIPISSAKNEDDIIRLNHYTNLRPLCSKINRDIKRDLI